MTKGKKKHPYVQTEKERVEKKKNIYMAEMARSNGKYDNGTSKNKIKMKRIHMYLYGTFDFD